MCGAPVPILADVCPGCGSDPDLHLVEVGALALGPRRGPPRGTSGDDGGPRPPRRAWWPLAIGALLIGAVVAVLAGAPDEAAEGAADDPTTTSTTRFTRTTRPHVPRSTTTTSTTVLGSPLLGEPTGLLLAAVQGNLVIDLDAGAEIRVRARIVGGHAGRLLVEDGTDLAWWPAPYDGTGAEVVAEDVDVDQVWVDSDDAVWAVTYGPAAGGRLLGFGPGGARYEHDLPPFWGPIAAADDRAVLSLPGGTFTISIDGDVDRVSTGSLVAAGGDRIVVSLCDRDLDCGVQVLRADGTAVGALPSLGSQAGLGVISSTGRFAITEWRDDGSTRVLVDGAAVATDVSGNYGGYALAWSPDGRWLFQQGERDVLVFDLVGGVPHTIDFDGGSEGYPMLVLTASG